MSEMSELMNFINSIASVGQNVATAQLNYAKAEEAQRHKEKLLDQKYEREQEDALLSDNISIVQTNIKNQEAEIDRLLAIGEDYNVTMSEHLSLKEEDRSDEMNELIKMFDMNINSDLSVTTKVFDTTNEMLDGLSAKQQVNQNIIEQLSGMEKDFNTLERSRRYLGKLAGDASILDMEDVKQLASEIRAGRFDPDKIQEYKDVFGEIPAYESIYGENITDASWESFQDEDIIQSTFFKDKPWLTQAMYSPEYLGEDTYGIVSSQSKQKTDAINLNNAISEAESKLFNRS